MTCHAGKGKVQSFLRANSDIESEEYNDSEVVIKARIGKSQLPALKRLGPDEIEIL